MTKSALRRHATEREKESRTSIDQWQNNGRARNSIDKYSLKTHGSQEKFTVASRDLKVVSPDNSQTRTSSSHRHIIVRGNGLERTHGLQERHKIVSPELKVVSPNKSQTRGVNSHEHIVRGREITQFSMYDERKPKPRAVSPDDKYHLSIVSPHFEQDELVYVAGSMRGDCFHSTSTCHGLRNARRGSNGVTTITKQGASMRNMRPCQLCKPSAVTAPAPSKLHLVQNERNQLMPASSRLHLVPYEGRVSKSSNQLVPTTSHQLTRYTDADTTSSTVYIAASLKGQCYHSHVGCKGLRDANGVMSIPLQNVDIMGMRPCRVCRPTERGVSQHVDYSSCASNQCITNYRDCNEKSTLVTTAEITSVGNKMYWVTPSGQCYHSTRSCSSLRRSKTVLQECSTMGRRACSKCC
eukprot:scaffold30603_cov21-Cyclotella_meneghiniana.AAC.2